MSIEERVMSLRRQRHTLIVEPSSGFPTTVELAYRLSNVVTAKTGEPVGAWKLGGATAGTQAAFKTDRVYYGALLAGEIAVQPVRLPFSLSPLRGEAEIALRLARDVFDRSDLVSGSLFDAFAPAIECPWSIVANLPAAGLPALLSDRCAAGLLLLGAARPVDAVAMNAPIAMYSGERLLAQGCADKDLLLTPIDIAFEAVNTILINGSAVRAGQWISTGGITACVDLPRDGAFSLVFDNKVEFIVASGEAA